MAKSKNKQGKLKAIIPYTFEQYLSRVSQMVYSRRMFSIKPEHLERNKKKLLEIVDYKLYRYTDPRQRSEYILVEVPIDTKGHIY